MDVKKLQTLIVQTNESLEREALHIAEHLIEQISIEQCRIIAANDHIIELRKKLKELEVPQLSPAAVLGE
jgi:hypothetical protein